MTSGILNVLKPCGMTSHDVVGFLRRTLQTKKIGHGGTLDPDAAGVLPVFIGTATRLLEYAVEGRKNYRAELKFGIKTDTETTVVRSLPVQRFVLLLKPKFKKLCKNLSVNKNRFRPCTLL